MNGKYNQSYQPLGDLTIEFPIAGEVTDYRRELDLGAGRGPGAVHQQGVRYTREVFASHPAQAIVVRLTATSRARFRSRRRSAASCTMRRRAEQQMPAPDRPLPGHVDPSYCGPGVVWDDAPDGKGMRFETRLVPSHEGGRVTITDAGDHGGRLRQRHAAAGRRDQLQRAVEEPQPGRQRPRQACAMIPRAAGREALRALPRRPTWPITSASSTA